MLLIPLNSVLKMAQSPMSLVERSEVAKIVIPKVVTPKVESKKEVVKVVKKEPKAIPTPTLEWITPSKSACIHNDGKVQSDGGCEANWRDANRTCQAMGGRLPTIYELRLVVVECGGEMSDNDSAEWTRNENNSEYKQKYKEKGFTSRSYWSSTTDVSDSSYAWNVYFYGGRDYWSRKTRENYVRCVRGG